MQWFRSPAKRRSAEPRRRRGPLADRELESKRLGPTLDLEVHGVARAPERKLANERFCRHNLSTINGGDDIAADRVPNTINEFFARTLTQS